MSAGSIKFPRVCSTVLWAANQMFVFTSFSEFIDNLLLPPTVFLFPRRWGVGLTAGQALGEKITDKAPRQAISSVPTFFISRPLFEFAAAVNELWYTCETGKLLWSA